MLIGVIGCGFRMKSNLKRFFNISQTAKIESIYDPNQDCMDDYINSFGKDIKKCSSFLEVINNPIIDWIFIGSPNYVHKSQILSALNCGKNIFSEKPLAINISELTEIKQKFDEKGKSFLVSYPLRYSPYYLKIKEIINNCEIGRVISFEFNETLGLDHGSFIMTNWRRLEKFSGGHLLEKCCHDFDVANLLIDSLPSKIASFGGLNCFHSENKIFFNNIKINCDLFGVNYLKDPFNSDKDIVDNQVIILEYRNGVRATFHTNCASALPERRIYICGTKGTIKANLLEGKIELKLFSSTNTFITLYDNIVEGHGGGDKLLMSELAKAINDKKNFYSTLDDGIKSAIVALGAEKSRKENIIVDMEEIWKKFGY